MTPATILHSVICTRHVQLAVVAVEAVLPVGTAGEPVVPAPSAVASAEAKASPKICAAARASC
ncbi:MAG TPA: hypothetical protein VIC27_03545, partial [Ktedonobacterales bacterium]